MEHILYSVNTGERLYLNPEEREAFFLATKSQETNVKYFCQMLYFTGARLNEVLGITYLSFDFNQKGVFVKTLRQREAGVFRIIALPDEFFEILNDVYQIKKNQTIEKKKDLRLWDFTDRTGENYIKKVMTCAGISGKKANARGLRHAFGVAAATNEIPMQQLQQWLGHCYPGSTIVYDQIYKNASSKIS